MVMDDNESCGSRVVESSAGKSRQQRKKEEVYNEVLRRLREADHIEAQEPSFDGQLWAHFNRLPARYAMDVNVERAEDVLTHRRLLHLAQDPANRPAFEVRLVQVVPVLDGNSGDSVHSRSPRKGSIHPPPAFGSSPNLEALALGTSKLENQDGDSVTDAGAKFPRPMHEITFSTDDKPKLLSQLSFDLIEKWIKKNPKASICSPQGVDAFKDIAIFQDYHGLPEFRNSVAKFMAKGRGDKVSFDPERIIMAGGATGANELLMFCLADPGDAFLIPTPYYPAFDRDLRWRTGVQLLPVVCESSNNFRITKEALEDAYENAQKANINVKGLIFTNPSNPLGTTMDKATLNTLLTFINDKQIHIVCDEVYAATVHTQDYVSISEVAQEMEDKCNLDLIHVVYSLSKDMGLPGFRVGIVYSYNDTVVNIGRKMSSFGLVSSQTQHLLASMLSDEKFVDEFLFESTKRLASRHESFTKGLEHVGIRCLKSNAGLYCWMDLKPLLKEPTFEEEMSLWRVIINKVKINVSPGSSFHCHEPGWFRVCFANMDDETMEVALTRIRMFVENGKEMAKMVVKKEYKMWKRALTLNLSSRIFDENVTMNVPISSPHMMSPHSPLLRART